MTSNNKKKRLIPVILIKNGWVVQSESFKFFKNIGHPIPTIKRLSEFGSDELIILDITKDQFYENRREDMNYSFKEGFLDILREVSAVSFMPISVGGKIRTLEDANIRIKNGAEKIIVNFLAINDHNEIKRIIKSYGSQAVVASIDYILDDEKKYKVFLEGKKMTNINPISLAKKLIDIGVGEIFINSVDRDGKKNGYDIDFLENFCEEINAPVIVCGGAGSWGDMYEVFSKTKCDGIAAANIFHHIEHSVYLAKDHLSKKSGKFRAPKFYYD
jgi:imidazole glycerol-phosphate synthase subunit HisF